MPIHKKSGFTTYQSKTPVHGFTLIELLITISIIAILSAIGLVIFSSVIKQGRDSKRQADLRSIQSALEQYNSDRGYYPANVTFGGALAGGGKTYMNTIPGDSDSTRTYYYAAVGASYCLYAQMDTLTNSNCSAHSPHNFAVTPP